VKALVDADSREFPSVTPRVPAAVWGEREIRDMYGLIPVGLPDQRRLVLPDDWPEDMHPCAKMRWIIDCALNRRLIPKRIRLSMRATAMRG